MNVDGILPELIKLLKKHQKDLIEILFKYLKDSVPTNYQSVPITESKLKIDIITLCTYSMMFSQGNEIY